MVGKLALRCRNSVKGEQYRARLASCEQPEGRGNNCNCLQRRDGWVEEKQGERDWPGFQGIQGEPWWSAVSKGGVEKEGGAGANGELWSAEGRTDGQGRGEGVRQGLVARVSSGGQL